MSSERIVGVDTCSIQKFDGPKDSLKEYKEEIKQKTRRNTLFKFMDEESKASFYQSISVKE